MKRVLLLGSQHGNERLGDGLYDFMCRRYPELKGEVSFLLANPRAHKANVRFIETDMNRSYVGTAVTYEQRRARFVRNYIRKGNYDLVLDLHTTTVKQEDCAIVSAISDQNRVFLDLMPMKNIVVMRHPLVARSLNAQFSCVVSIEVSESRLGDELYDALCMALSGFLKGYAAHSQKQTFVVDKLIRSRDFTVQELRGMRNFELFEGSFYPVLLGEDSYRKYTPYLGFRADNMQEIKL